MGGEEAGSLYQVRLWWLSLGRGGGIQAVEDYRAHLRNHFPILDRLGGDEPTTHNNSLLS